MKFWYTKINSKLLLTSAAGEFHPQEYSISQQQEEQVLHMPALSWYHTIVHTATLSTGCLLQGARTHHALSAEKEWRCTLFGFF